ncbi:diguanylate cyclase domain-containing protein [Aquipseudomonas ullengensis]|uniref:Diguanylate cyclase n=1 Tax=Aquipseudomonas ullengensis TaxID=2759166 RepID=A0A7W4QC17_9GAMM|nr:diguanylate cyclase [Pseudomonas ullengensis]MBB2497234.1 diguanylate cyclase [Pseudomonas ullengensis]
MIALAALALATALTLFVLLLRAKRAQQELAQYRGLIDKLTDGVLRIDQDGRIRQFNPAAARLLGKPEAQLQDCLLSELIPEAGSLTSLQGLTAPGAEGGNICLHVLPAAADASVIVLIQPASDSEGSTEDAQRFQRSQYFARIGTWDWDIDTNRLYWSDAIYALFGYQVGEVVPSYELFVASVHPDDREQVRIGEVRCIETGENHDEEYRVIWPDGSLHWLRETGNVIKDAQGTPVKMMGVVRDITEEKAWASQMHQLAHHDALTGLPNRLVFEDRLRNALERARRNGTRVALVFIDLDGFKAINDTHGHAAGDQVLVTTALRLKGALRESDSVARVGGDEFVVILEGLTLEQPLEEEAQGIAQKILAALAAPLSIGQQQQCIGASLGIAVFPDHAPSMDRLIHIADLAMYEAKRSGENQYRLGSDTPPRTSTE